MRTRFFRWLDRRLSARYRDRPIVRREQVIARPDIQMMPFASEETIYYAQSKLPLPDIFQTGENTYQPYVLAVDDARLQGRHALALTADGQILLESVQNNPFTLPKRSVGEVHSPANFRELWHQLRHRPHYETVFALTNPYQNAYYHWMLENLPRLWLYEQYVAQTDTHPPLLIDAKTPAYVRETLQLLNIDNILWWDATQASFERLLLPSALHKSGEPSPIAVRWLSDRLKAATPERAPSPHKRLYISRRQARERRVLNEDEVLVLLSQHGFEMVELEGMSIAQQIALFEGADVVIGAHGAAFSNMIFSEKLTVIEFMPEDYLNACFYALASGLGFEYAVLVSPSAARRDMHIDIAQLQSALITLGLA